MSSCMTHPWPNKPGRSSEDCHRDGRKLRARQAARIRLLGILNKSEASPDRDANNAETLARHPRIENINLRAYARTAS